jgi:hypothetical protein
LLFRHEDELVLCTGPKGRPFVTVTVRGMGAIGAARPLVMWDEVDEFQVTAGLPRSRFRRMVGIAGLMFRDGQDADQTPDPDVFPDRVHATWVFTRRNESKSGGFGYVPRWASPQELDDTLRVVRAVAAANNANERASLIAAIPPR